MGLTRPRAYQIFDIDYKQSVRVITLSNITLSGGAPTVVDGVTLSAGNRVLVAGQNTGSQNGLYQVSVLGTGSNGTWIRSVDGNETGEVEAGMIVMVTEGDIYKDTQWKLTTNDPIVIGVTALTFEQNSAFAFGNIYANGTAVLADIVGDTVTFTPADNLIITANATSDTVTFAVSQSPSFTGTLGVTGNATVGNISTAGQVTATGSVTGGNLITTGSGGNIIMSGGNITGANVVSANTISSVGNISINSSGNIWIFDTTGNATFPANGTTNLHDVRSVGLATFSNVQIGGNLNYAESANLIVVEDKDGFADIIAQNLNAGGNASMNIVLVNNDPGNVYMAVGVNSSTFTPLYNTLFEIPDAGYVSHSTTQVMGPQSAESGTSKMYFTYNSGSLALELNDFGAIGWGASYNGNLTQGNFGNVGQVLTSAGNSSPPTWNNAVSVAGNVSGGNLITAGLANVGTLTVNGGSTFTGNLLPTANITYNLGSPTQRWKEIFLSGNTIDIGGATISADLETGSLVLRGPSGAEFILTGSSPTDSFGIFGLIEAGNTSPATSTTTGALQVAGGAGIAGNIFAGGIVDIAGNSIYLGNLVLKDNGSNIFGLYAADGVTPATISQTSVDTTKISNGTSNVQVVSANANVTVSVGGTSNVMVVSTAGANVLGTLGVSGNITGSNLTGSLITGTLTTAAQPNVTSVGTLTSVSVTGNVSGGNLVTTGTVATGTLTTSGNATIAGNLTVSGNVISVNVTDLNVVDPIIGLGRGANNTPLTTNDGKDRGEQLWYYTTAEQSAFIGYDNSAGKLIAATNVSVSSEVVTVNNYGNLIVGGLEAATISATGNANVGNLGATTVTATTLTGTISTAAQPNITSVGTLTSLAVTGNVTGGNLTTGSQIIATGNVTGGNFTTTGQVVATGNIHGALIKASSNVEIQNRGILFLNDSDNSNYIGLRSPATLTGNFTYIFPTGYGNASQVLTTNGAGGLTWEDQSGGGGGGSATSFPNSTVSPVPGSTGNFDLSYNFVQTSQEIPFESGATDPFGVNLGEVYSMMDPGGEILDPVDLGVLT